MKKRISNIVGPGNSSDNPLDLHAYTYCSSESELIPALVIWPKTTDQARRVMLYSNQTHTPVVIRGSGTSKADGCVDDNLNVLSSERMKKIIKLDLKNKVVEAEAGIRIRDLNNILKDFKMHFPLVPFNPVKTIGGMLALDMLTKESHQVGSMSQWIEEAEFVDGTGKYYYSKKKDVVAGREGITGFITRAKLRITERPVLSIDIHGFTELSELLKRIRLLKNDKEVYFMEFIDTKTAHELGFENKYALVTAYTSLKAKEKEVLRVKRIIEKLNSAHSMLRSRGYYYLQDPFVSLEKAYDLIQWCEKNNARLHGHAGLGLFYAYFLKEDKSLVKTFRSFVRRINGSLGRGFGYGTANKDFVNPVKKKELIKLKDEHDYNNILNPGKVVDYR